MDFREYFTPIVLERGREYFYEDLVEVTFIDKREINTIVFGSEAYNVEIENIGTNNMTMMCDCPHAQDDNYCKHMAASMFMFEDLNGKEKPEKTGKKIDEEKLLHVITSAEITNIKAWIYNLCKEDAEMYHKFISEITLMEKRETEESNKPKHLKTYQKEVRETYQSHTKKGFIDYYNAMNLVRELIQYLEDEIPKLYNHPVRAIKLLNYTITQYESYAIDDSAGGYNELLGCVYTLSIQVIDDADDKQQEELFNVYAVALSEVEGAAREVIEDIFFDRFESERQLNLKVRVLEKIVANEEIIGYEKKQALERLVMVYQSQKVSNEIIIEKLTPYQQYEPVRDFMIAVALNKGSTECAIQLMKEGMQSEYPGIVKRYHERLIHLYRQIGHADYVYELFNYIVENRWANLDCYNELKAAYTDEEWAQVREYIFRKYDDNQEVFQYFLEDKLYERILGGLEASKFNFAWFCEAKNQLIVYDKNRTIRIYERFVNRMAAEANNRKAYKNVMEHLQDIRKLQGEQPIAERIASQWRLLYKKRPAMIDELNKVMG